MADRERVVRANGITIRVRATSVAGRHTAELVHHDGRGVQRALVDAASEAELAEVVDAAVQAFAASVGLRRRS